MVKRNAHSPITPSCPARVPHDAAADDRGHDDPQSVADDAGVLRALGQVVRPAHWPLAGQRHDRRSPRLPVTSRAPTDRVVPRTPSA